MKTINRYSKIYLKFFKFNLIYAMTYRVSFLMELGVEVFYAFTTILFFHLIYGKIQTLAGWSYYELMFLIGMDIVLTGIYVGFIFACNTNNLPEAIKDGMIDSVLLKPLNSQFMLTISRVYIPSLLSMIPGFYLIFQAVTHLNISFNVINIMSAVIIFICGLVIAYSFMTISASMAFIFTNAKLLPRIGMNFMAFYDARPHHIFKTTILKTIFYFILPVIFVGSVPVTTITRGVELPYLIMAITLATIFFLLTRYIWSSMIKHYSSASS